MTLDWSSGHLCGCVGMSVPVPAVGDSICRQNESASTSAGEPSESSMLYGDWLPSVSSVLHSLLLGKGMDRLLQILTCGIPCNWLRAALLYVIGSLGQSEYEAVLVLAGLESRGSQLPTPPQAWQVGSVPGEVLLAPKFPLVWH